MAPTSRAQSPPALTICSAVDGSLVGDNIPAAVRALVGLDYLAVGFNRGAAHAGGLGIGVGGSRGVQVAVQRVIKPANDPFDIGRRSDFGNLFGADDFGFQPHDAMLGALRFHHVKAFLGVCQCHPAHVVQPAGHAGDLFQLAIELDGIALKCCHIGVAIESMKPACGVPGRARGELGAFQQHHIRPAEFGQMVKD